MKKFLTYLVVLLITFSILFSHVFSISAEVDVNDEAMRAFINEISSKLPEFSIWQESKIHDRQPLHSPTDYSVNAILYELNFKDDACGYVIVDSRSQKIIEFSSGISPYRQYLNAYRAKKLANRLIKKEILVYYPGMYAIAVTIADSKDPEIIEFMSDSSVTIKVDGISRMQLNDALGGTILSSPTHYKLISGVPDANYTISCIPTAIGNAIGYWDTHGYPNLIISPATIYTAISEVNQRLIDYCGNNTSNSAIPAATQGYCKARYPSNFTVTNVWNPSYTTYTGQIIYNRPTLVGFASGGPYSGAHMTVGVGYYYEDGEPDKYVIVHDAWAPADNHYQLWGSYNDFIAKIIP